MYDAYFVEGPMDGRWYTLNGPHPTFKVMRPPRSIDLGAVAPEAHITPVEGTYEIKARDDDNGTLVYRWLGWDDELQKVQKNQGE